MMGILLFLRKSMERIIMKMRNNFENRSTINGTKKCKIFKKVCPTKWEKTTFSIEHLMNYKNYWATTPQSKLRAESNLPSQSQFLFWVPMPLNT
jgi:hypothetical protein